MRKPAQFFISSLLFTLLFCLIVLPARSLGPTTTDRVVEWLQFQVPVESQANFIQKDQKIWTTFLSQQKGFIRKEVLTDLTKPEELMLLIYWQTLADWQSIPQSRLDKVQTRFEQELGMYYPIVESRAYHLHDTTQTQSAIQHPANL